MSKPNLKACPHCLTEFQPKRKNQLYCATECRTDANNALAKGRYATFKEEVPKVDSIKAQLKSMSAYIAGLTIVVKGATKTDKDTVKWEGRSYKRTSKAHQPVEVHIVKGYGIMIPGNTILFNEGTATNGSGIWAYVLDK